MSIENSPTTIDIGEQGRAIFEAAAALEGQLIATQSGLEGLKQSYTDNNICVRATLAWIAELRHQSQMFTGKSGKIPAGNQTATTALSPSLRELSILGVTYADLYRRLNVEESIFEAMMNENELAKVPEAKEIPAVEILGPSEVPERESLLPRLLIMTFGTTGTFTLGVVYILGSACWRACDRQDSAKVFAMEIFRSLKMQISKVIFTGPCGMRLRV